jgi:serine/threonine protein phosphatase 1
LQNGGQATIDSYQQGVPPEHLQLLNSSQSYFIMGNRLFVHAGILPERSVEAQDDGIFLWDRSLFKKAIAAYMHHQDQPLTIYDEVYIGHCPIHRYDIVEPVRGGGVWMMDTGAGWEGRLSMMDVHTKQVFQSDQVDGFYPPGSGRGG